MPSSTSVPLEFGRGLQERLDLLVIGIAHDLLDARAIVPAAVEQDDFAGRRQMLDVALEIPFGLFALGRARKRDHAALARVEDAREHVDRPALAGGVAPFENDDDALPGFGDPARQRHQLPAEGLEQLFIFRLIKLAVAAHSGSLWARLWHGRKREWNTPLALESRCNDAVDERPIAALGPDRRPPVAARGLVRAPPAHPRRACARADRRSATSSWSNCATPRAGGFPAAAAPPMNRPSKPCCASCARKSA